MKKLLNIFFVSAIAAMMLLSCVKDEDLNIADPNKIASDNVFSSGEAAIQALNGAYAPLAEVNLWGNEIHFFLSQASGEFSLKWKGEVRWNQFENLTLLTEDNQAVKGFWISLYNVIYRANDVLHNIDKVPSGELTEQRIEQAKGEAYFLRGFAYSYLIMMFSDYYPNKTIDGWGVPIIIENAGSREEMFVPRSSVEEVMNQAISDFDQAAQLLPESWSGQDKGRAIKYGAVGMKGRLYHFLGLYQEATEAFEEVVNNSAHELVPDFRSLFDGSNENNSESLFEIQYALPEVSSNNSYNYGPGPAYPWTHGNGAIGGWENVGIPDESVIPLEGDPRQRATVFMEGDTVKPGTTWNTYPFNSIGYSPKKWIRIDEPARFGASSTEFSGEINMTILRLADIYLMYSEALIESGGSEETAREYINKVRRRAHEVNIDVASDYDVPPGSPNLLDTLKNERYVEFFGEGIYWFDLVRWGNAPDSLSEKGFVEGKHERLPIPIQEIELNEALEGQQNQGY